MTKLADLMDIGDLQQEIRDGFVRLRWHPHAPTMILNYTEKAQYEKHWNHITRQTRGLIVDTETNEVLARPFDKFFNYGEYDEASLAKFLSHDRAVHVTDKMDGSLGILYPTPGGFGHSIATRGSFESEQAVHASLLLNTRYKDFVPLEGWTYLFEIVYPENRIVLDYKGADDLFLLAMRHIESGEISGAISLGGSGWPGPKTETLHYNIPFSAALDQADRENREGIVIRAIHGGFMLKIKQEDYVRLHKLVTGLNERAVWEHLSKHCGTYGELLAQVPDEFHEWVTVTAEGFLDDFESLSAYAHVTYESITAILDKTQGWMPDATDRDYRKAFAGYARECRHPGLLFQMLDGRDISDAIWKDLKPKGETPSLMNRNEDNA